MPRLARTDRMGALGQSQGRRFRQHPPAAVFAPFADSEDGATHRAPSDLMGSSANNPCRFQPLTEGAVGRQMRDQHDREAAEDDPDEEVDDVRLPDPDMVTLTPTAQERNRPPSCSRCLSSAVISTLEGVSRNTWSATFSIDPPSA